MKDEQEVSRALDEYGDTVRRVCFLYLKNYHDVEDVFQDVFLKYALFEKTFESHAHERAWLIRVSVNACKDILKSFLRKKVTSIEDLVNEPSYIPEESEEVLDAVLRLPEKYRIVIYMFYYEGYAATEIAKILGKRENTIYTWLSRGKTQLKSALGGEHLG